MPDPNPSIAITPKPRSTLVFFLLAFTISWTAWIPPALVSHGLLSVSPNSTLIGAGGAFGPFFASIITSRVFDGKQGIRDLFRRFLVWRVGSQWYLFVLVWPPVLSLVKTALHMLLGGQAPDFAHPPFTQYYPLPSELRMINPFVFMPLVFVQQSLFGSSRGEEPGWRGYALPRLQARVNALWAGVIVGIFWGLWHLPFALTKGHPLAETFFGWTLLGLIANSILFTWVYNNTKGSLLVAVLFHTSIAITGLFLSASEPHFLISLALTWSVVILIVMKLGPHDLARHSVNE